MKKKAKTIIVLVVIIILLAVLLVPYEHVTVADGGTVVYHAIAYSAVHYHSFKDPLFVENDGSIKQVYNVGWTVKVFGNEIFNNVHEENY